MDQKTGGRTRQFRQTSRLVHNGSRSLPVTFTCDLDTGKCATSGPGTARPGNGCFDEQLCLYPQADWNGQLLVLNPADIKNQGKCIRRTVRSYIDNDANESGVGQADGTSKSYVTHLHVYDNPDCSSASPHRSKALDPQTAEPSLTSGGSGVTVQSVKITNDEVTPTTRH